MGGHVHVVEFIVQIIVYIVCIFRQSEVIKGFLEPF